MANQKPKEWQVTFKYGDPHQYRNWSDLRRYALGQLDEWQQWCQRYNKAGLLTLEGMKKEIGEAEIEGKGNRPAVEIYSYVLGLSRDGRHHDWPTTDAAVAAVRACYEECMAPGYFKDEGLFDVAADDEQDWPA